ncbi:MAG: type I 3-dehydroquinate dehydratase [Butyricicoccus sp.]|nr:type I 3-dehydroquinate dehydratase [Butyricicoccus sp.]
MKQTVLIKNVEFGAGQPKICLPVVARTDAEIGQQLAVIAHSGPDLVEFRADWYADIMDRSARRFALDGIRTVLPQTPLLFTYRTRREGGESELADADYLRLCLEVIEDGAADLIDVELFMGEGIVSEIVRAAHEKGIAVICSSHDFAKTPAREELLRRFRAMEALDADILKLAVMPQSPEDVLTLLSATAEMDAAGSRPVISMSMGRLGAISRLCGEQFGSCVTFGAAGKASAPGQIEARALRTILETLHE